MNRPKVFSIGDRVLSLLVGVVIAPSTFGGFVADKGSLSSAVLQNGIFCVHKRGLRSLLEVTVNKGARQRESFHALATAWLWSEPTCCLVGR